MNIGKNIKFVRIARSVKQYDMAKSLGISQNYLCLLENNKREPSLSLLKKISDVYDVSLPFLVADHSPAEAVYILCKDKQ